MKKYLKNTWFVLYSAGCLLSCSSQDYTTLNLVPGLQYQVLFRAGDTVVTSAGKKTTAKGDNDLNLYFPEKGSSEHGHLFIGHETHSVNDISGDGGGASWVEIRKSNGKWAVVGKPKAIDFSGVGGTLKNCSGEKTATGLVLSGEEFPPSSNTKLYRSRKGVVEFRDTSDYKDLKRWQNMGWVVEIDPVKLKALRKLYKMGRFSHEDVLIMPNNKTVFLTDDYSPAVFFKFEALKPNDFSEGQLFAYAQSPDGKAGQWITLPMEMDSLIGIRNVAIRRGATLLQRTEWMSRIEDRIILSETGNDTFDWTKEIQVGGKPAKHLLDSCETEENHFEEVYGTLLQFKPGDGMLKPLLWGGKTQGGTFSNPDALASFSAGGKPFLVICEDINGADKGRSLVPGKYVNEVYVLDLSIAEPTRSNLVKIATLPYGSEPTGVYFTPDFSTMFMNVQHPNPANKHPFNRDATIAVTGLKELFK